MSRILVVDDDRELRDNIVEILTDAGYEIQSSDNAESALEVLDSKEFDLIIMDLIMPGMGGLAVLPLARQKCPNARIIVITAFSTVDNAVESMKKGADDYITKPFKINELLTAVQRNLEEARFDSYKTFLDMDDTFSSLSNVTRRKILTLLSKEKKIRFMDIARKLEIEDHTRMNFHLKVLKEADFVEQDNEKYYRLTNRGRKVTECLDFIVKSLTA